MAWREEADLGRRLRQEFEMQLEEAVSAVGV
jgi:hypothetical protein